MKRRKRHNKKIYRPIPRRFSRINSFTYQQLDLAKTSPLYIGSTTPVIIPNTEIPVQSSQYDEPIARSIHNLQEKDYDREFKQQAAEFINDEITRGANAADLIQRIYKHGNPQSNLQKLLNERIQRMSL